MSERWATVVSSSLVGKSANELKRWQTSLLTALMVLIYPRVDGWGVGGVEGGGTLHCRFAGFHFTVLFFRTSPGRRQRT